MENNENYISTEQSTNNFERPQENNFGGKGNKKKNKTFVIITIIILLLAVITCLYFITTKKESKSENGEVKKNSLKSAYSIKSNGLEDFDLHFLQLENKKENKIYSPLSIKYALEMLNEGTNGETKEQISSIIGKYNANKYTNSNNISLANALFIKDTYKSSVKENYINTLMSKYNAEVIYDSFGAPTVLNNWVNNKTFKLINNMFDDVSEQDFILVNALAIDMEWVNKIQSEHKDYTVIFKHEKFNTYITSLDSTDYSSIKFNNAMDNAKAVEIGATINKYDIVSTLGESNIRATVGKEYENWLKNNPEDVSCFYGDQKPLDTKSYLDKYIKEINEGYKHVSSSTDFNFYTDENVKVFAKDLKEYNGTTLQYIGIMPTNEDLDTYIKDINSAKVNILINNLKSIELENFKEGVITKIKGYIPLFKFDYELKLIDDLKKLGITNVFDSSKADLSNLTTKKSAITSASHKANIEFSNDGIKASAATEIGGRGAGMCGFDHLYDVPVEEIDLTFDKPYLFLIRDKKSGEVWFTGTVYSPVQHQ